MSSSTVKGFSRYLILAVVLTALISVIGTSAYFQMLVQPQPYTKTTTVTQTITEQARTTTITMFITTTQVTTPAPPSEKPKLEGKPGGTITIAVEKDETSLDPIFSQAGVFTDTILNHVYETLIAYDYNMNLVPRLAESFRQVDPITFEFSIRKGVKFHDGTELDGEVVKWNIERILTTPSPRQGQLSMVDRVETIDKYTVRFILKFPTSEFLPALTWGTGIVSKAAVEKYGSDYGTVAAIGTGPYKLVRWVKGDQAVLERYNDYWGPKPYMDRIILRVIPEASVRALSLERGEVQLAQLEPVDAKRLQGSKAINLYLGEPTRMIMISINQNPETQGTKALLDKRVRQAINYAIDRRGLVEAIQEGFAIAGIGPIPPALKQFWSEALRMYPETADIERAKQLLAEAGYPDGFETTLLNFFPWGLPVATVIQAQLAKVGIKVEINNMEFGAGAEQLLVKRKYDMALHDWAGTGAPTPFGVVGEFFDPTKVGEWQWNLQNVKDPILGWLVKELVRQPGFNAQKGVSDALQRRVIEEGYGVILFYPYKIHASTQVVKNYRVHPHPWYGCVLWMPVIEAFVWLEQD
jgi:peptide/nickel transport system substrate-binding protein